MRRAYYFRPEACPAARTTLRKSDERAAMPFADAAAADRQEACVEASEIALGKNRKSGRRPVKPDDYFAWGPFEFARFDKTAIWKSHATPEQTAAAQARMAEHFPNRQE